MFFSRYKTLTTQFGLFVLIPLIGVVLWLMGAFGRFGYPGPFHYVTEAEQLQSNKPLAGLFEDDKIETKNPQFDSALIDSRGFGDTADNMWQVNASAAVIGLDMPEPDKHRDGFTATLYPSYAKAVRGIYTGGMKILPSLCMLNGKAKQFDDGLYAELDAAMTAHKMKGFHDTSLMVRAILEKLEPAGEAYAWVWGGLDVGEFLSDAERKTAPKRAAAFVSAFDRNEIESKPIGFYTWSPDLQRTFHFLRYFQSKWNDRKGIPDAIAAVLAANPDLMAQYERMLDFYAHLTNPFRALTFKHLAAPENKGKSLREIARQNQREPCVCFLPYSTSRETELFNEIFRDGLPRGADLMMEFVKAIRSGKVDLKPRENSGWYDYQVYALETFLLPEIGKENEKLLLNKKYKEHMLESFRAILTKIRETHVRQLDLPTAAAPSFSPPSKELTPRLRVEPNPTFFLRTARAYAFLQTYLQSVIPDTVWEDLKGRKQDGERSMPLGEELDWMKNFFYGLHLLSCEDIGAKPFLLDGELKEPSACVDCAKLWLAGWEHDPDLAVDTRVAVPIYVDPGRNITRLWATIGVRGARLKSWYARRPQWRSANLGDSAPWQESRTGEVEYVILADDFAEIQLKGNRVLTREEFRAVCDREQTKEKIIRALAK